MSLASRYVVIMAGGKGERFWPQSRIRRPKHLLPIVGNKPMLTQTTDRLEGLVPVENVLIITNIEQREAVIEVCPKIPVENIIGEPVGRDTAAAVGLAATLVSIRDPKGVFAIIPADHVIHDFASFQSVLDAALDTASNSNAIVTVGIKPISPATGYGYIHRGNLEGESRGQSVYSVQKFVEKPDLETAKTYLESGEYLWNGGMFIWKSSVVEASLEAYVPQLKAALDEIKKRLQSGEDMQECLASQYPSLEKVSIDYAVIEKAENVKTLEATFDWDDVGEWPAIERHFPKDESGNVARGVVEIMDAQNNIVFAEEDHTIAVLGVQDLIIVNSPDATLISHKDRAQDIKKIVQKISGTDAGKNLM